jgi:hypothetical protein
MAIVSPQQRVPPCDLLIGGERYHARYLGPSDADALIALHLAIFGGSFNKKWFQWKYHDYQNPSLGLWTHGGQLIAHCGGIKRALFFKKILVHGLQITDVMVHPQWRAILSRRGPFYWVSYLFYQDQIGSDRPAQLGYGFPSMRHLQLATKLGLLQDGGTIWQMHWPSLPQNNTWFWRYEILEPHEPRWSSAIENAWHSMQTQAGALHLGDRSLMTMQWRYRLHPEHDYLYLSLQRSWSSSPSGIAIVRRHPDLDRGLLWLDWIGPPNQLKDALALVRQYASHHHFTEVLAWGSHTVRETLRSTLQYSETPIAGLGIPTQSDVAGETLAQQPWWWMAGDTDFL